MERIKCLLVVLLILGSLPLYFGTLQKNYKAPIDARCTYDLVITQGSRLDKLKIVIDIVRTHGPKKVKEFLLEIFRSCLPYGRKVIVMYVLMWIQLQQPSNVGRTKVLWRQFLCVENVL